MTSALAPLPCGRSPGHAARSRQRKRPPSPGSRVSMCANGQCRPVRGATSRSSHRSSAHRYSTTLPTPHGRLSRAATTTVTSANGCGPGAAAGEAERRFDPQPERRPAGRLRHGQNPPPGTVNTTTPASPARSQPGNLKPPGARVSGSRRRARDCHWAQLQTSGPWPANLPRLAGAQPGSR